MLIVIDGELQSIPRWAALIQRDFPFMRHENGGENNAYRKYGFECGECCSALIRECCEKITARYLQDGVETGDIDLIPTRIREENGTLCFRYTYKADGEIDQAKAKLRQDIKAIVRAIEEKAAAI